MIGSFEGIHFLHYATRTCPKSESIFIQQFFPLRETVYYHSELYSVSFPVSRANVGCSSTGLEVDRQCDIWVHVSAFLWQNALCGGETSKLGNKYISAACVKTKS